MDAMETPSRRRRWLHALVRVHHHLALPGLGLLLAPIYCGPQTADYHWIWVAGAFLIATALCVELLIGVGRLASETDDLRSTVAHDGDTNDRRARPEGRSDVEH